MKISDTCQIPGLLNIFKKYFKDKGIFVEVGGNDGYKWSNTWGLAEAGWRGLYYEPDKEMADKCRITHANNNVYVADIAVGSHNGITKLYKGQGGATTSRRVSETDIFDHGNSKNNYELAKVCALNQSLPQHEIPNEFELLVIDTNGDVMAVLNGLNLNIWHPKMIIVETHKDHAGWNFEAAEIDERLSPHYKEIYHDSINSIYICKGYK